MKKTAAIFLILLLSLPHPLSADEERHYVFNRVEFGADMANPYVTSIFKDREGTIWAGSKTGVDRLSASGHNNYPLGEAVVSITEDYLGEIWATTADGILRYDRYSDSFKNIGSQAKGQCVACAGEIWASELNHLWRIGCQPPFEARETVFPDNIGITSIAFLPDGTPLFGTRDSGIWRYDPVSGGISRFSSTEPPFIMTMTVHEGTVYAGTYGDGVFIYDSTGAYKGDIPGLPSGYITSFTSFEGQLWISTDGAGLASYDPGSGTVQIFSHVPGDGSTPPSNAIKCILGDDTGNELWIGTVRYGLYNAHSNFIRTYGESPLGSEQGLSEKCAFGHFLDDDGVLWLGTDGQGLNSFDTRSGKFRHYPSTFGKFIPAVSAYGKDEILAHRYTEGLVLFNKRTGASKNFAADIDERVDRVDFPYKVNDDKIIVLNHKSWVIDKRSGKVTQMIKEDGTPATELSMGWYCKDFVLAFSGNTIYINNLTDNVFHFLCDVGNQGNIGGLTYDRVHQWLWVGTGQGGHFGYFTFNPKAPYSAGPFICQPYSPFTSVSCMTADPEGHIWIASEARLYLYAPDEDNFRIFGPLDGYDLNDVLYGHYTDVTDGHIYFSGPSGLASINIAIAEEAQSERDISMCLSEIVTDSKRYVFKPADPKSVSIPWNHGKIRLNFAINGGRFLDRNIYKYEISGKDDSQLSSTSASLELVTLAPGSYTVSAWCESGSPKENPEKETVTLTVRAPWYKSVIFRLLEILLCLALATAAIFLIVKKNMVHTGIVRDARSESDDEFLTKFKTIVDENITGEITTELLMMSLGMSRTPLFEKVKKLTGYSLHDYIKRLRITKAVNLLKTTDMTVNEISSATGFSYPRHFSSVFKELTGTTPTQFRKEVAAQNRRSK